MSGAGGARLSVLVVAHNEAAQLADCLAGLAFADEILVLLDRCTDGSAAIARSFTEHVVEGAWEREGDRRNAAIAAARGEWLLEIDADERVPRELAAEILATVATSSADWHKVPVANHVGGRLIRHGWGASFGRSAHGALFRPGAKRWGPQRVHPKVTFAGTEGPRLTAAIQHHVGGDISGLLRRLDRYSTLHAQDLREGGDIGSYGHNVRRIFSRFYKCYVGRRGYREGAWGFLIALLAGLYPILSYLKARLER